MNNKNLFKDEKAYTMETVEEFGAIHYFISFEDNEKVIHKTEVSQDFYDEFQKLQRNVRNMERSDERNVSGGGFIDEAIAFESMPLEDVITLKDAIASLTPTQRRRFLLHFVHGLSLREIARLECRDHKAILKSVESSKDMILKYFYG